MQVPMTLLYARDKISHCKLLSKTPKKIGTTPLKINTLNPKITQLKRKIIWTKPPWLWVPMLIFRDVVPDTAPVSMGENPFDKSCCKYHRKPVGHILVTSHQLRFTTVNAADGKVPNRFSHMVVKNGDLPGKKQQKSPWNKNPSKRSAGEVPQHTTSEEQFSFPKTCSFPSIFVFSQLLPLKTIPPSGNNAFNKALLGDDGIEHKIPFNNKSYFEKGGNNVATRGPLSPFNRILKGGVEIPLIFPNVP